MMSVEFDYPASRTFSVAELLHIRDQIRRGLPGFVDSSPSDVLHVGFPVATRLPALDIPAGLAVSGVIVSGRLPKDPDPYALFRRMFHQVEEAGCTLAAKCDFEEQPKSGETRRRCNTISAATNGVARWIGYRALGGRTSRDSTYLRDYFSRLIERLDLPMILKDTRHGFTLEHTGSGRLSLNMGNGAANYRAFDCDIPGASADDLLRRMQTCVQECARGRIFGHRWSVTNRENSQNPLLGKQVYDWIAGAGFRMQSGMVGLTVSLRELAALDGLKSLCGPKGQAYMMLFAFELSDGMLGRLDVCTRSDGHHLSLVLPDPDELPRVQAILNLPLQETPSV